MHPKYAPKPSQASAVVGLWRDGDNLVVDQALARFPSRCVKSGEPVFGTMHALKLTKTIQNEGSVTVELAVPLSPEWVDRAQSSMWAIIVGVGGLMIFGGIGLALWQPVFVLAVMAGVPVLIGGLIGMMVQSGSVLQLKHFAGGKVWLTGASPGFLVQLPAWNPLATPTASDHPLSESLPAGKMAGQNNLAVNTPSAESDAAASPAGPVRSHLIASPVKVRAQKFHQMWWVYGLGFAMSLVFTIVTMTQVFGLKPGQQVRVWAPIALAYQLFGPAGAVAVPGVICVVCLALMISRIGAGEDK
jgi:hypothetical protein